MMGSVSDEVDVWIAEEDIPVNAKLRPVRVRSDVYPGDEEEAEA